MKKGIKLNSSKLNLLAKLHCLTWVLMSLFPITLYSQPANPGQDVSTFEQKFGLGLVTFEEKSIELNLYKTPTAENPYKTLEINKIWFELQHDNWLRPQIYYPEDGYFLFICRNKRSGWFEIELNKLSRNTAWIKVADGFFFKEWGELLSNAYSIDAQRATNAIYEKQDANSTKINFYKWADIIPTGYEGDWLKVSEGFAEVYPPEGHQLQSGWLRWRDANDFLIGYNIVYD